MMRSHHKSLVDVLISQAKVRSQETAYLFLKRSPIIEDKITYASLDLAARTIAAAIQEKNLQKGDRALLIYAPGLDLIKAFYGCLYAGVLAVPVYPPTNDKLIQKVHRIVENSTPQLILATQEGFEKFAKQQSQYDHLPCLSTDGISEKYAEQWVNRSVSSNDLAFLQYTSGSTMHPKGVAVSHENLLCNLEGIYQILEMNTQSIMLGWLPPYHDMGLIGLIFQPLYAGVPGILMSPFDFLQNPTIWLKNIDKYRATITGAPNFAYDYCVKRIKEKNKQGLDLSSLKVLFNGAEPIHPESMEKFYEAFKGCRFRREMFLPCYGLAEATLLVTGKSVEHDYAVIDVPKYLLQAHQYQNKNKIPMKSPTKRIVSCGKIVQPLTIVDPETLEACEEDRIGEIWIYGPTVAQGYWNDIEKTQESFHATIKGDHSGRFYLRTGDLGFIHGDELYVTGRIKDLIILYGKNYYPQDIEYTVSHCHPLVRAGNCAAFSIEDDDEYRLVVIVEVERPQLGKVESDEISNRIFESVYQAHEIEVYAIGFVAPRALPKTTSGKIRRNFCRQYWLKDSLSLLARWQLTTSK